MAQPHIPGYQILEQSGGTSDTTIWKAVQISLERSVTIWVLKPQAAADATLLKHFDTIIRAVARIRHPNFAQVIDISHTEEGIPYIIFENSDYTPLSNILIKNGRLAPEQAFAVAREIAVGLDAAWRQCGFLHRNLKPENILVSPDGKVKITNYNSATIVASGVDPLEYDGGMMVGTPNYASPEQVDCLRTIDFRSDMYSLGAVLYQATTGITPFNEVTDPVQVLNLQRSGTITNPRTINSKIKQPFVHVMTRLMAKNPDDRYGSWDEAVNDFNRVLSGKPPFTEPGRSADPPSTIAPVQGYSLPATSSASAPSDTIRFPTDSIGSDSASHSAYATGAAANRKSSGSMNTRSSRRAGLGRTMNTKSFSPSLSLSVLMFVAMCAAALYAGYRTLKWIGPVGEHADAENAITDVPEISAGTDMSENEGQYADSTASSYGGETIADSGASEGYSETPGAGAASETGGLTPYPGVGSSGMSGAAEPENTASLPPQKALMREIYNAFLTKDVVSAKRYASRRFNESKNLPGIDLGECKRVWSLLKQAQPEAEFVGSLLVRYNSTAFMPLEYREHTISIKPESHINGVLTATEKLPSGKTRTININLADLSPETMYDIMLSSADNTEAMLVTRTILAIKLGRHADIKLNMSRMPNLVPVLEFAQ